MNLNNTGLNEMLKRINIKYLLLLVLLICAIVIGYYFYMKLPKKVTGYHGLELGMNAGELKYRKGEPDYLLSKEDYSGIIFFLRPYNDEPPESPPREFEEVDKNKVRELPKAMDVRPWGNSPNALPNGSKVEDYEMWRYYKDDSSNILDVKMDVPNGRIVEIACFSRKGNFCEKINGIGIKSTEFNVKKNLGEPSKETINDLVKKIEYKNYNLEFYLAKEKVFYIIVREYDD